MKTRKHKRVPATLDRQLPVLTFYEAARTALAKARSTDEVKAVRDKSEHMKLYARQAKDRDLLADAVEIHLRAERRLGEMIGIGKANKQISRGQPPKKDGERERRLRLADAGIDHKLSSKAQRAAALPVKAFETVVKTTREKIMAGGAAVIDPLAIVTTEEKQHRRNARERVLGECQQALPDSKYGVILADPEWRFEPWSRQTGLDRSADNHYPTSCTEVIAARDVPAIAAKDCVLFLWATAPMLPQALVVMAAWGFDYRSNYVWSKDKIGTGYWNRNAHEHLLVGVKGDIPAPAHGTQRPSVIEGRVGKHSAKPDVFLEMIESYFPTLPKIELNRRGPARNGWDAWGNESEPIAPAKPKTRKAA